MVINRLGSKRHCIATVVELVDSPTRDLMMIKDILNFILKTIQIFQWMSMYIVNQETVVLFMVMNQVAIFPNITTTSYSRVQQLFIGIIQMIPNI
jgi:hypothetical protein